MDPTTLSLAEYLLHVSRNVNFILLASSMIAYFDWLQVFESEIKLIWNRGGVQMKALYSLTRYIPLLYLPLFYVYRFQTDSTDSKCTNIHIAMGTLFAIGALCAALIVTIRTWAVWAKKKYMTYVLFGTYTLATALIVIFFIISLKYTSHPTVFTGLPLGCIPKYESHYLPAAFVVEAAYDTIILAQMLIRGISLYRWGRGSRLFQTLYRDGIMFYVYITAVSIGNAVLLFSQPLQGNYDVILLPLQGVIRSVLACRIILHIRMQYDELQMSMLPTTKSGHPNVLADVGDVTKLSDLGGSVSVK